MTKIEELEQKLNECQKALAELKESKKECKWKPTVGEKYWFKNDIGKVSHSTYMCSVDECRANNIPIFPTEEECERYCRFMDTVKEKSYEFSKEEWEDWNIYKHYIYYDFGDKEFFVEQDTIDRDLGTYYFKTEEDAQYIIDNFKEELMEYFL